MRKVLFFLVFGISAGLFAQEGIERVLAQIEQNNPTLQAYSRQNQAGKLATRVGLLPDDPELELGRLKGRPVDLGSRTDFSVRQVFDFPLAYWQRHRLASERRAQLDWEWQKQRRALLLEARLLCLDVVLANAMRRELGRQLAWAKDLARAVGLKYERGEANVLEWNKVRLTLLNLEKEAESNEIERNALLAELTSLNGGAVVELTDDGFDRGQVPDDFTSWYQRIEQRDPQLSWLRCEVSCLEWQVKLDRALNLPRLAIGYQSESVSGERFSGVTAGISLPLFQRRGVVRAGKAQAEAMRSVAADGNRQFFQQMKTLHSRVVALQQSAQDYRTRLAELDNTPLLRKAFDGGEISLIEYVLELSQLHDSTVRLLQAEWSLGKALALVWQSSL